MGLFSKPIKTLDDLFRPHTLEDIYYAETQITKALPTMIDKANTPALKDAFTTHLKETQGQIARLERVFSQLGHPVKGVTCQAIEGIIAESKEVMNEIAGSAGPGAQVCCPLPKPWSIMRSRAMAHSSRSPSNLDTPTAWRFSSRRSPRKKPPTGS